MKSILVILFILVSSPFLKSQNIMSNQTVFENFVLQINDHNVDGIYILMSDDHTFIDALGNKTQGRDKAKNQWEIIFDVFPNYKIIINNVMENATVFLADGNVEATLKKIKNDQNNDHYKLPAAWKAEIENGKIKSWQIFSDTQVPSSLMNSIMVNDDDKVTGFGGVFVKSKDPKALGEWYNKHLGTSFGKESYMMFEWSERGNANSKASTTFGIFGEKSKYFDPSTKEMMLNFRVKDLHKLLDKLKAEGVTLVGTPEDYDYGKFGWIMDIDGNKIELWEPIDKVLDDYEQENKK